MDQTEAKRSRARGLTVRAIENLKPRHGQRTERFDTGGVAGLSIRANVDGSRTWNLMFRTKNGNVLRRLKIGGYPVLGLAAVRDLARAKLAIVATGGDPADDAVADRKAKTFGQFVPVFLAAKKHKRSVSQYERTLTKIAEAEHWKHKAIVDIDSEHVRELVERIAGRGTPILANRTRAALSSFFKVAIQRKIIQHNPCVPVDRQPEPERTRVLDAAEIRTLWAALDDESLTAISAPVARWLKFLLLTAQRSGETVRMKWADLDLPDDWQTSRTLRGGWWTIPGTETKNGKTHRVWLTKTAIGLLREARHAAPEARWVFPSPARPYTHVGSCAKKAMAKLRRVGAITFAERATAHDLRRTVIDHLRRHCKVGRDTVAFVVNHELRSGGAATSRYDFYEGETEKQDAMLRWERRLIGILNEDQQKVVSFSR